MPIPAYISAPTLRSSEKLARILSIYPILESLVEHSHRSHILNLSRTSHALHDVLSTTIGPLCKPFRSCIENLNRCALCQEIVCKDCGQETHELEKPTEVMTEYGFTYALLCGQTPALRNQISKTLQKVSYRWGYGIIRQTIEHKNFCDTCFPKYRPTMGKSALERRPDWVNQNILSIESDLNRWIDPVTARGLVATDLKWENLPQAHGICNCDGFSAGCKASPHIVKVESLPVECELAAFVWLPESVRGDLPGVHVNVPIFVLDKPLDGAEAGGSEI
ncbi:hypothetical protein EV426DRAFT_94367 [Tirmania nivea]|nr:hypothetical protein EV426DRAFT_94367 [Tirmania nivea]